MQLDKISCENHSFSSKLSTNREQQLIVYSHNGSELTQPTYRCYGPIIPSYTSKCTCRQQPLLPTSYISEFHKSLSGVDYIDFDVSETLLSSKQVRNDDNNNNNNDDPLDCIKYLFNDNDKIEQQQQQNENVIRRTARRSTNTSSISTDSGYCDISIASSKLIPVHLISCTLIPVNVIRTKSMDIRCLACTYPSSSIYLSNNMERQRRKSSTHSSHSHPNRTYSRQYMEAIENEINNCCSCNNKYCSTMTMYPTLSLSSPIGTKFVTKIDDNHDDNYVCKQQRQQQQQQTHSRKKRTSLLKSVYMQKKIIIFFSY